MMIKFLPHGKGRGAKAAGYLVDDYDHAHNKREGVKILSGDPEIFSTICDSISNQWKYTSCVIAFAPEDQPTEAQIKEVIEEFEAHAFIGLEPTQYHIFAVLHEEEHAKHIHILTPRIELDSRKALNIAPPNHQNYFDPLRDYFNYKYNWARPDDLLRKKDYQFPNHIEKQHKELKKNQIQQYLSEYIKTLIEREMVNNHDDVITCLKEIPEITMVKASKHAKTDYISIKVEGREKAIRLKGAIYDHDFTAETYREARTRTENLAQERTRNGTNPSTDQAKANAAYQRARTLRRQREQHHQKIYQPQPSTAPITRRSTPSFDRDTSPKTTTTEQSKPNLDLYGRNGTDIRSDQTSDRALHPYPNGYPIHARNIPKRKTENLLRDWVYCGRNSLMPNIDHDNIKLIMDESSSASHHRGIWFFNPPLLQHNGLENEYIRKFTERPSDCAQNPSTPTKPDHQTTRTTDPGIQALNRCCDRTKQTITSNQQYTRSTFEQATITNFTRKNTDAIQRASRSTITRHQLDRSISETIHSDEHELKNRLHRANHYITDANQRHTALRTNAEKTLRGDTKPIGQSNQFDKHTQQIRELIQSLEDQIVCFQPRPHNAAIPSDTYYNLGCISSNYEEYEYLIDDQALNQTFKQVTDNLVFTDQKRLPQAFTALIQYVERAEQYSRTLQLDISSFLEKDFTQYASEKDFTRQLNLEIQKKELLHLSRYLEHLNFIQNTQKYAELDRMHSYSIQKLNDEIQHVYKDWKLDKYDQRGLSPFVHLFREKIPRLQQKLENLIELKRNEVIPSIEEKQVIALSTLERKKQEYVPKQKPAQQEIKPQPSNDFGFF